MFLFQPRLTISVDEAWALINNDVLPCNDVITYTNPNTNVGLANLYK